MPTLIDGLRLWPGGSLVSGGITEGGGSATGSVTQWEPPLPYTIDDTPQEDSTFIGFTKDGRGWDAVNIIAGLQCGAAGPFTIDLIVWVGFIFPIISGSDSSATYWAQVVQLNWISNSAFHRNWGNVGPFPSSTRILNTTASSLTNYFRPLVYPRTNTAASATDLAANGFGRNTVVETVDPVEDSLYSGMFTIPINGAIGAVYRVNQLIVTGAALTSLNLRLGAQLLRVEM